MRTNKAGDRIRLGMLVGDTDGYRMGRIVGIRKDACPPIKRYIYRKFRASDVDFPTGEYKTSWLIMPCTSLKLSSVCRERLPVRKLWDKPRSML